MNYQREWGNPRNAVGFAAVCARLALPFYDGDSRPDLVATIELAERCARGEEITNDAANDANAAADVVGRVDTINPCIAYTAGYAAATIVAPSYAASTALFAGYSGVCAHEIRVAFARWVVRDLSRGRELSAELRQAAGAAVVAGDEDLAKELLQ